MNQIKFIDYPGKIAVSIFNFLSEDSSFSIIGFQLSYLFFVLVLSLLIYLKFLNSVRNYSGIKKILCSPILFLTVSGIGVILLRIPNLVLRELNSDESQWIVNAATYYNGAVLWKDVSGFTGGPLIYLPLSLINHFGIELSYASIRMFGVIAYIIPIILFTYFTFRNLFNETYSSVFTLPIILFFSLSISNDFIAFNSELVSMVLIALSCFLFISFIKGNSILKLIILGLILGCFPYAKLQAVPIGLIIALLSVTEIFFFEAPSKTKKVFSVFIFIIAGMLPSLTFLVYLLNNDALNIFIDDYILQNILYTNNGLASHIDGLAKFNLVLILSSHTIETIWLFIVCMIVILFSSLQLFKTRSKIELQNFRVLIYLFLILVFSYISVCFPGNIFEHYQLLLIVPLIIFTGFIFGTSLPLSKSIFSTNKQLITFVLVSVFIPLAITLYKGNKGINFIAAKGNYQISSVSKEILKYTMPNERLAVWGWNHKFYIETGLIQGTRHANSYIEVYQYLRKQSIYLENYIEELKFNKPVIFLDATQPTFIGFTNPENLGHDKFPVLNNFIKSNYTLVSEINQKKIYVLNDRLIRMGLL